MTARRPKMTTQTTPCFQFGCLTNMSEWVSRWGGLWHISALGPIVTQFFHEVNITHQHQPKGSHCTSCTHTVIFSKSPCRSLLTYPSNLRFNKFNILSNKSVYLVQLAYHSYWGYSFLSHAKTIAPVWGPLTLASHHSWFLYCAKIWLGYISFCCQNP